MAVLNLRDRIAQGVTRHVVGPLFRDSTQARSLADHVAAIGVPDIAPDGVPTQVSTLVGPLEAVATVVQDPRDAAVTILWHAGYAERNPAAAVSALLRLDHPLPAQVLAIRPPFHDTVRTVMQATRTLDPWVAMAATGIGVVEALRRQATRPVLVLGYSLGGFVTLGHLVHHGSADMYAPLACGQRLGTVMAEVHIGGRLSKVERKRVARALDLDVDLSAHLGTRLNPVQCEHDRMSPASIQVPAYGGPVTVWPSGHLATPRQLGVHGRPFVDGLIARLTA